MRCTVSDCLAGGAVQVMGNASLSDVDLTRTYRVVSTAALLTAPSAFAIWGNETVSKAQSTPYEGMLDAVERALASGMQPEPVTEESIVASKGPPPLNPACVARATAVQTDVSTRSLSRTARKALGDRASMVLNVRAEGSAAFEGVYKVNSALHRKDNATAASSIEQEFTSEVGPTFGLQLSWTNESGATRIGLSYKQQALQFAAGIDFRQLGCNESGVETSQCPADGDTVTTTIGFASRDDPSVQSESVVKTTIEAVPSCTHSVGQSSLQAGEEIVGKATVPLLAFANDLDRLPIRYTQAYVEFKWDGTVLPFKRSAGTAEFRVDVFPAAVALCSGVCCRVE